VHVNQPIIVPWKAGQVAYWSPGCGRYTRVPNGAGLTQVKAGGRSSSHRSRGGGVHSSGEGRRHLAHHSDPGDGRRYSTRHSDPEPGGTYLIGCRSLIGNGDD
jgi:hypothetical protein